MNSIYNLPWWKEILEESPNRVDFFQRINSDTLSERIRDYLLNERMITAFLDHHVSYIWLLNISSDKSTGNIFRESPWNQYNFWIAMSKNQSLQGQASTLIHECIHGIYRSVGSDNQHSSNEKIILGLEQSFFSDNTDFSINVFKKYKLIYT